VLTIYLKEEFFFSKDEKEKELKSQGGRSISERPISKSIALKSPCKKKQVFAGLSSV
jgi:hypothetical protein